MSITVCKGSIRVNSWLLDFIPAFVPAVVAPNLLGKQEKLPVDAAAAI
jgi:hypothetical protein